METKQDAIKPAMDQRVNQEIKKQPWDKWKHCFSKFIECSKNSSKREVYSYTFLLQETRKILNKWSNFIPKGS